MGWKRCPGCGARMKSGRDRLVCHNCHVRAQRLAGRQVRKEEILDILAETDAKHAERSTRTVARRRVVRVSGDAMLCSDLHVPFHDPQMVGWMCETARKLEIDQLVIGGDLIDFFQVSRFRRIHGGGAGVLESLVLTFDLLGVLARTFRKIYVIRGNHDDRLQRLIESAIERRNEAQRILASLQQEDIAATPYRQRYVTILEEWTRNAPGELADVIYWSEEPMIRLKGPKGHDDWLFVHPAIYSRNAPHTERRLWQRYTCPIIGSHGHLFGASIAPNGKHAIVQLGCMTDPEKHVYLMDRVTDHPAWVQGFGTLIGGRIRLYVKNPYYWSE